MKKCAFVYLSFILLMFFFNGCIFYKEKLWLNKDGSGKMVMKIGIDKNLYSMRDSTDRFDIDEISNALDSIIGVTINETKSYSDKDTEWFEIILAFESLKFINELEGLEDGVATSLMGKISITKDENENLIFIRKITPKKESEKKEKPLEGMVQTMFSQYSWEYETYFPSKVLTANTANENIDEGNNRVTWSFSLPSLMKEPKVMKATIMNPKSAYYNSIKLYGIIAVVVIAILIFALYKKDTSTRPKKKYQPRLQSPSRPSAVLQSSIVDQLEELEKLASLRDKGVLTEEEFTDLKRKLLDS